MNNNKLYIIKDDKLRDHSNDLTGIDFNRKLGIIVSSCKGGVIKIWTYFKTFISEIQFPNKVDSVCFLNENGDILIAHD